MLTEQQLNEIVIRCEAATPGPWKFWMEGRDHQSGSSFIQTPSEDIELSGGAEADLDFIAHARQDVPSLLAEILRFRNPCTPAFDASSLVIGQTYYMLTFADVERTIPGVEPLVYIGAEVFTPDEADGGRRSKLWFQDVVSFRLYGNAKDVEDNAQWAGQSYLRAFDLDTVGSGLLDLGGTADAITLAQRRNLEVFANVAP